MKRVAFVGRLLGIALIVGLLAACADSARSTQSAGGTPPRTPPPVQSVPPASVTPASPAAKLAIRGTPSSPSPGPSLSTFVTPTPIAAVSTVPPGTQQAVQIVVKPGVPAVAVADRIAGPGAIVQRGPQGGPVPAPEDADRMRRTWLVPVPPGTEQEALARAQRDPGVESVQLVRWPPLVSYPE